MVHSVAVNKGIIFAVHNGKTYRFDGSNKSSIELDLRKIGLVQDGRFLVGIASESKDVIVLDANNLEEKAKHTFPKRPSAWTISGDWLIVSDKFGDVFKASLLSAQNQPDTSEDGFGSAILGHVSMVLALAATPNRIFSSDRDEHIRISVFPESYVIDKFLLGHQAFVSHLVLDGRYLLSCGGDSYAISWDWETGSELKRLSLVNSGEVKEDEVNEVGVISAVISKSRVYLALQDSSNIVVADFPSFDNSEIINTGAIVHSLTSDESGVYLASASCVSKLGSEEPILTLEGESPYEIVSEKQFRKR